MEIVLYPSSQTGRNTCHAAQAWVCWEHGLGERQAVERKIASCPSKHAWEQASFLRMSFETTFSFAFFFKFYLYCLCVWLFCLYVCLSIMPEKARNRASDILELELQMSCHVDAGNWSSERPANALNCWATLRVHAAWRREHWGWKSGGLSSLLGPHPQLLLGSAILHLTQSSPHLRLHSRAQHLS